MSSAVITRSEKFRTPLSGEKEIGLWVDRIGCGRDYYNVNIKKLRLLGLYAVVAVTDGCGHFESTLSGQLEVAESDVMLLFPDVPNRYGPGYSWQTLWIVWDGPESERLRKMGLFSPYNPLIKGAAPIVAEYHSLLTELMDREDMLTIFERKNLVLDLLLKLYRRQMEKNVDSENVIRSAIIFINNNINRELSVADVAGRCNLSESHFRRLFKVATGRSPKEFIISRKISRAKSLLSSRLPVKEISTMLGYRDEFYFRRIFRKVTGITPGQYMASLFHRE